MELSLLPPDLTCHCSLNFSLWFPPLLLNMSINWWGGWPFPPCLSARFVLSFYIALSFLDSVLFVPFHPHLPPSVHRCGAFALCQSASSLQSSKHPSSTSLVGLLWSRFFITFFKENFFLLLLVFREVFKTILVLFPLTSTKHPSHILFLNPELAWTEREGRPVSCSSCRRHSPKESLEGQ